MPSKLNLENTETEYFKILTEAPKKNNRTQWNCICKRCGNKCIISTNSLRNTQKTKSCGCLHRDKLIERNKNNFKDLTGQIFGKLTVIQKTSSLRGHTGWICQCECGNIITTDSGSLRSGDRTSCGCANQSIGVINIENILKTYNINYQKEYSFADLKSPKNHLLYFDFAIFDENNNLIKLIEYDGEQHFSDQGDNIFFSDNLQTRQINDDLKNKYCFNHNILLLRIPYTLKNKITYKLLFEESE